VSSPSSKLFVRTELIPSKAPPLSEIGATKWVRENLFSNTINSILTILSLFLIYGLLSQILPWMTQGVWEADSLNECRKIRESLGGNTNVACWAVINERWHQLLFGFYPPESYWRPILALILFGFAISPVLFTSVRKELYLLTFSSPFLCFWLLWGNTIWGPVSAAFNFLLGILLFQQISRSKLSVLSIPITFVFAVLYWLFLLTPVAEHLDSFIPISLSYIPSKEFGGFMLALIIGITGIILSLPIGILLALGRQSNLLIINKICVFFIEIIRGVPLIVWLFTASLLLNYFLPPGTNFDLMLRVVIMVTLFASAYMAEVIRGGLAALSVGQHEGSSSLGLNYWQSMRLIILPQALKISIPGIVNTFIGLFKDTTLVVFIGLLDPIGLSNAIRATTDWNGIYWELFIFIGLLFFVCCFSMSRYSQFLERRLQTEHR
jgi:general L-amino acid transport system permease protein